jgi:hypothetical protein
LKPLLEQVLPEQPFLHAVQHVLESHPEQVQP